MKWEPFTQYHISSDIVVYSDDQKYLDSLNTPDGIKKLVLLPASIRCLISLSFYFV